MTFFDSKFNCALITFLISMVPVLECRAAIPTGVALGLPEPLVFIISAAGNLLPVPFIIIFVKAVFKWLRSKNAKLEKFVNHLEDKARSKSGQVVKYGFWGLILFVGIPLPGTGAWTGSLIAALLNIENKKACIAITIGVMIACILIMTLSLGAKSVINLL